MSHAIIPSEPIHSIMISYFVELTRRRKRKTMGEEAETNKSAHIRHI